MDSSSQPKILIVDDRPENLYALNKTLQPLNLEIIQAQNGNDALGFALENDFFVAILDVQMPEMDGYELAELLRGNPSTATLPIIFVSAVFSDEYHHRKGYDAGAVDFIAKPFVPEILISKIRVFLDLYHQRRALQDAVAQLNAANYQLASVNAELQTFGYSVSHDLRAPLRAIDGYSRVLVETIGEQVHPQALHYLKTIRENAQMMDSLIDGLLEFSRLAFHPLTPRTIPMTELARYALDSSLALEPDRKIETSLADLPEAWGDQALIQQVFGILTANAVKFTRKSPAARIEIGVDEKNGAPVYFVRDNGVGFNMQYAEKLFGIFQRMHSPTDFEGTGVGLASAHRIIVRHGGEIWAEAEADKGATFYFTLPQPA